jgi:hypothetical protein
MCQLNYHVAIITSTSNPKLIHVMNSRHIVSLLYQELPVLTISVNLNSKYFMCIYLHTQTLSWTPAIIEWDAYEKTSKEKGPQILGAPSQYSIRRLFFYCLLRRCNTGTESANQIFTPSVRIVTGESVGNMLIVIDDGDDRKDAKQILTALALVSTKLT